MKLNTLGIFVFTAVATTAFVWMANRPSAEGQIMQFGIPTQTTTEKAKAPELVDEKPAEELAPTESSSPMEGSTEAEKTE